ncbi:NAD(P)H-dependent oxidoreductase [Aliamphritea spongicola]|uniref:NAD(P)H-dependent oxidoreductase n=1 Tax=Aliamphritea spongicola TaxID=707589 RepID=UPI00196B9088|nr:NAD(P)H-dependent oxidoreductase [Aliamphritea spongicola]MBN3560775.1 NAD(P)H-dependent oxidoreductase [Aliamphritea spongicola]
MSRVVVISGHPDLKKSNANTVVLEALHSGLESTDIRRLDSLYPDYRIDVAAEQQALLEAEVIILQFPFYWYSVPALLKKWLDDVLAYDFAYGANGDKLKGKDLVLSFTIGGPEEAYDPQGYNHFPIAELIKPLQQTAYLAGMNFQPPVYSHRMVYIPGVYNKLEDVQQQAEDHGKRLVDTVQARLDSGDSQLKNFVTQWFATFDQLPEDPQYFLKHLAQDVHWVMPEGSYQGHQGFLDWYTEIRKSIKPGCVHQVEQVSIQKEGADVQIELRIRLLAERFEDGQPINMLVNEYWQVNHTDDHLIINDYQVEQING